MTDLSDLIERVRAATGPDNALDIDIDIALFTPDSQHVSVRPNAHGTKCVYQRHDGGTDTFWSSDHTLTPDSRETAIRRLLAVQATGAK